MVVRCFSLYHYAYVFVLSFPACHTWLNAQLNLGKGGDSGTILRDGDHNGLSSANTFSELHGYLGAYRRVPSQNE